MSSFSPMKIHKADSHLVYTTLTKDNTGRVWPLRNKLTLPSHPKLLSKNEILPFQIGLMMHTQSLVNNVFCIISDLEAFFYMPIAQTVNRGIVAT